MASVSVILPAAGLATRFGGDRNKILELIDDQPVFAHSIRLFSRREDVGQILLVVSQDDRQTISDEYGELLRKENVTLVDGGEDRTGSVRNALRQVWPDAQWVCIHDAVRPCLSARSIDEVFAAAAEGGAAILAWPIHGTIKRAAGEHIAETVDRVDLWQAQTPQVFRRDWLEEAYATGESATDDAAMLERAGRSVRLVAGDPRNVKITTPADLAMAAAAMKTLG
ncbi:MAG: 2-C-methyl-D-erythritol 4-phosphate cytidylyltransferase [Planctomycetota bacterium]|jgi:2-C-methyl-D-erythritol 4-phosphate cytidylyltransferase